LETVVPQFWPEAPCTGVFPGSGLA